MKTAWEIEDAIQELEEEKADILLMPEADVLTMYNVDHRAEIFELISEELDWLRSEYERALEREELEEAGWTRRDREYMAY
jgi:formate-dependent phosphoribosylglycinamide formyltransferase (GAR transformylase)